MTTRSNAASGEVVVPREPTLGRRAMLYVGMSHVESVISI